MNSQNKNALEECLRELDAFFRLPHTTDECRDAVNDINRYYELLKAETNSKDINLVRIFYKITGWKNRPCCTDELRKKLLQIRESVVSLFIEQKINDANTLEELNALVDIVEKCKHIREDGHVLSKIYVKKVILEVNEVGVPSFEIILDKYKNSIYYGKIKIETIKHVVLSYIYGTNGAPVDIPKAISLTNNHLETNLSHDIYHRVLKIVDDLVEADNIPTAVHYLSLIPNEYSVEKRKSLIEINEERTIQEIEGLDNPADNQIISLATIYLFSDIRKHKNEEKGISLLWHLLANNKNVTAMSLLLRYFNRNKADGGKLVYKVVEYALANGIEVEKEYLDIYLAVKSKIERMLKEKELIRNELKRRKIEYLVHFSHEENIPSILEHGILSRNMLRINSIEFKCTDDSRADNELDYISTSVTSPNFPMLENKMNELKMIPVVFFIDANILCDPKIDSVFYVTNAANGFMNNESGRDCKSFNNMFKDSLIVKTNEEERTWNRFGKNDNETTDSQAEVMIKDNIPLKYIKKAFFRRNKSWKYYINGKEIKD